VTSPSGETHAAASTARNGEATSDPSAPIRAAEKPAELAPPALRLPPQLRGLRAAFVFLTRLPVSGFPYSAADFAWAPAHFPIVGLVIGGAGALVLWSLAPLGPLLAGALAVTTTVWLTGAFHEDGLADTCDALGGAHGPKRILDILKDSRIGAYGAVALVLSLLLRVSALGELGSRAVVALPLAHVLARTSPVWLMASLPYVTGPDAKGSSVASGGKWPQAAVATAWSVLLCALGHRLGWFSLRELAVAVAACAVCAVWLARKFERRAGGLTGDFLGALEQVTELCVLLALLAVTRLAMLPDVFPATLGAP
jgi:adenosylcobinamide-GDP ribazoletransferase